MAILFFLFLFVCTDFVCICYYSHCTLLRFSALYWLHRYGLNCVFFLVLRTLSLFYFIIIIVVLSATMSWWNKAYHIFCSTRTRCRGSLHHGGSVRAREFDKKERSLIDRCAPRRHLITKYSRSLIRFNLVMQPIVTTTTHTGCLQ